MAERPSAIITGEWHRQCRILASTPWCCRHTQLFRKVLLREIGEEMTGRRRRSCCWGSCGGRFPSKPRRSRREARAHKKCPLQIDRSLLRQFHHRGYLQDQSPSHSGRCHQAILRNCGAQFRSMGYPPEPEALVERPFQNWSDPRQKSFHKDFLSRQKASHGWE